MTNSNFIAHDVFLDAEIAYRQCRVRRDYAATRRWTRTRGDGPTRVEQRMAGT